MKLADVEHAKAEIQACAAAQEFQFTDDEFAEFARIKQRFLDDIQSVLVKALVREFLALPDIAELVKAHEARERWRVRHRLVRLLRRRAR